MALFLALLVAVQAAATLTTADASPVSKVLVLLQDMRVQLEKEGEEDKDVYQKVSCWCTTNSGDKTASVSDAEARITQLTSTIEGKTAESARLSTEIKNLDDEVAKNTEALATATAMRRKELKEFTAEEKDVFASIAALKQAINVLGKHHALMQMPNDKLLNLVALVEGQLKEHKEVVDSIVTPSQQKALKAFYASPADFFTQTNAQYAPQSGAIFGILEQMKETFDTNLAGSQKDEAKAQSEYEALKAAKTAEIDAGTSQSEAKSQELADADEKLAQAEQDKEDTENGLAADVKFMANLKETCKMVDHEFEVRTKTRTEEIEAVSEALAILSSDDAKDTFTRTYDRASFLQLSISDDRARQAAAVVFKAAKAAGSPKLAAIAEAIASSTQLDAFTKVNAAIDQMVVDLKKQKADEIALRDSCRKEILDNENAQADMAYTIKNLDAEIADAAETIAGLTQSINQLSAEVAEMKTQKLHAGQDREKEYNDFKLTVADQRATQNLVQKALDRLNEFYGKKDAGAGLLQAKHTQEPPAAFKTYKKDKAGGVVGLLAGVVAEAKQLEADATQAESEAQKAYEAFVQDTNNSVDTKNRDITTKTAARAEKSADKTAAETNLEAARNEQSQNEATNADLHKSCDFTLNNFSARQAANDQEREALREAKAILAGSGMKLFLQKSA